MSELKISPELLQISPEVQDALKNKKPVVALESTIISHGMPFPQNAQTAIEVEETIRKQGAVPATIAIIGGVMKVGLSKEEIELLGREGHNVTKVSRRDFWFYRGGGGGVFCGCATPCAGNRPAWFTGAGGGDAFQLDECDHCRVLYWFSLSVIA